MLLPGGGCNFYVRRVREGNVCAEYLMTSVGGFAERRSTFRPVITLKSNILIKSGDGTSTTPYDIGI